MKQYIVTVNFGKGSQRLRSMLVSGKMFMLLSLASMVMVIAAGIGAMLHRQSPAPLSAPLSGMAVNVPNQLLSSMLSMEIDAAGTKLMNPVTGKQAASMLVHALSNMSAVVPGKGQMLADQYVMELNKQNAMQREGGAKDGKNAGLMVQAGAEGSGSDNDGVSGVNVTKTGNTRNEGGKLSASSVKEQVSKPGSSSSGADMPAKQPASNPSASDHAAHTTGQDKVIFIYHSHNRESWTPELNNGKQDPSDPVTNVTLLGKRLKEQLEAQGIGAEASDVDYPTAIQNFNWVLSYKYSKETVKQAIAVNDKLSFFFDIHRDSQHRKITTATIDGKAYAKVMFIIGQVNPNWKENENFANQIHESLEASYPGISRGIYGKTAATGNGEYNQSLSPNSLVIEVGGIDNTLEESYRTMDVLAKTIASIYWDAEKVNAPKAS